MMNEQHQQSANNTLPTTYFDLIHKVGSKGNYQFKVFLIFSMNWFLAGILLMGTSFLFMNVKYDCGADKSLSNKSCKDVVCQMNPNQIQNYTKKQIQSLATQFGPYYCDDVLELDFYRTILYLGTLFGYIFFLFFTDNFGRKMSAVFAWSVTTVGIWILCLSPNMGVACFGLFLAGAGCQSCIRISMAIFGEIVDYYKRQQYSVSLEIAFAFSGVTIGVIYWIFKRWRLVTMIFCGIPAVIQLLLLIFYVQQTPKFLIRKGKQKAMASLNRIAYINGLDANIITEADIDSVRQNQFNSVEDEKKIVTPLDLFRYKSQRVTTICTSIIFFCITFIYFGPIVIIDKLGLNDFVSQIIVSMSELIAYPIAFCFIKVSKRRRNGFIFFGISAVFTFILCFIEPSKDCNGCKQGIVQVVFVFGSRFCVSYYFAILFLYVTELFPLRLRGLGFGIASAAGALASSSSQVILTTFQDKEINPMIMFTALAIVAIICLPFLPETHNQPLMDQIPEVLEEKMRSRKSSTPRQSQDYHPQTPKSPQIQNTAKNHIQMLPLPEEVAN